MFFLVVDERTMTEFGGHLMIGKLTRPCVVTSTDYSIPTVFKGIKKNALIIVDNTRLQNLVTAVATAVDGGYFHRCGVVLLLDSSMAAAAKQEAEGDTAEENAVEVEGDKAEDAAVSAAPAEVPTDRPSRASITTIGRLVS